MVKCKNCGKPVDPTSEEVLCDACIAMQQVIEAIAKTFYEKWIVFKPYEDGFESDKDYCRTVAKSVLDLTYPSSQPMIAILAEDQILPRNKMSMASKLLYATAEEARQDMLKDNWRRILPPKDVKRRIGG